MKNLDLNKFGVQEMNVEEVVFQNGGGMAGPPMGSYMTEAQIAATGKAIRDAVDYVAGFCNGLFGL